MKLFSISQILAITATLATTTVAGMPALQAVSVPSATLPVTQQLIAKADTPLAKQLQGKPVVVDIYASWCPGCKNIAPTLSQLKQQYGTKANFIVFDVSDSKKTQASMKIAAKLGLTNFFNANKSQTSTVAIIDPTSGKIIKQFRNNPELADYTSTLNLSISQMSHGDAMKKPGDAMVHGDAMGHGDGMKKTGDAMGHGDAMKK
jgi:thiol-disulfide isomerase/thioredoxin